MNTSPALRLALALLLAAPAAGLAAGLGPAAHAQVADRVVRGYVPPDELVSFPAETPMDQFLRIVNPTFVRVTGKRVVDPRDRTAPIGVALNGVHFIDAFELVLDRANLDFTESEGYFIVAEPAVVSATTDGLAADAIGAEPLVAGAAAGPGPDVPATADTREVRIDAVIFQLNSRRAREVGTNWPALFEQAGGGGDYFVDAGSFFDVLDGFIETSADRVELATVLDLFRFFEEQGYGQTVATPFTVVQSGEQGMLQSGQDIPIQVRDFSGNTITEYVSTGTIINVTPTLVVDEREGDPVEFVHLAVKVEKSTAVPTGAGVAINKDNVVTQLPLFPGEMRAIGGLTSTDETVSRRGVPVLKDIPLLKYLFSYKQTVVTQNEIVIVLRARLVDDMRTRIDRDLPRDLLRQEREDYRERLEVLDPALVPEVDAER
jgi:type IV pilus assembly protein PilQ